MPIQIGDKIPNVTLKRLVDGALADVSTGELFGGRKVVLFSVPGAYTPTCSNQHLPGFVASAEDLKGKGVDEIVCVAVNDPWVMKAWGEQHGADGKVTMLPDGNGGWRRFWEQGYVTETVGVWMQDAGYRTGLVGKYMNGYPDDPGGFVEVGERVETAAARPQ